MAQSFVNPVGSGPSVTGGAVSTPEENVAVLVPPTPGNADLLINAGIGSTAAIAAGGDWSLGVESF